MKSKLKLLIAIIALALITICTNDLVRAQYTDNYTARFNGTDSYVAVQWHNDLQPSSAITIEAWVNPSALPVSSACIVGKNYTSSYYFGIENTGRFVVFPKGGSGLFLRSRVNSVVKVNQWTHIAATYDGTNTRLYINGLLDTSRTGITGAVGSNFDSLFIGCDRQSGVKAYFFEGQLDNVRIWKSARTAAQISGNMFIPLNIYQLPGPFSFLGASYQFDNNTKDFGGPAQNHGAARNITFVSYKDKAINHADYNNNYVFNGSTDYCSHYHIGAMANPTTTITLEAWIRRDTIGGSSAQNIVNKSGGASNYNYALFIFSGGQAVFAINGGSFNVQTNALVTNRQWTHLAATYNSATGTAILYVNGKQEATSTFSGKPQINFTNDSLYIGGIGASNYAANKFKGQIDDVRIWRVVRNAQQINDNMYKHPIDSITSNDSLMNFDADYLHSGFQLDQTFYNYGLIFVGNTYISSARANFNLLSSPMLSDANNEFYNSGFTTSTRRFFVPDASASGITDSIQISGFGPVSNLKVFLLMSHTYAQDMQVFLTSPSGTTIILMSQKGGNGDDIMTMFSDQADSIASSGFGAFYKNGIIAPFGPSVKPDQALSTLNGQDRNGYWRLKCIDLAGSDIGYVHGWGINLTSYKTLKVTANIQGFYNPATDKMRPDTARMYFRIPLPPFPIVDSSKAVLDSNGVGTFYFNKVNNGYRMIRHRNSIETWSANPIPFSGDTSSTDFSSAANAAYGSNQIQVDNSPVKYAIYGGDVNQDGAVDLTDIIACFNDANAFVSGYVTTDLTGDDYVDLSDINIAFNNANLFVTVVSP